MRSTKNTENKANLIFFMVAGGMRQGRTTGQIAMFKKAYEENPELAMKLLFHIRDIRQGMGERKMFRTILNNIARIWPESVIKNLHLIPEYGRYDDFWCLMGTPAQDEMISIVKKQLEKDIEAVERRESGEYNAYVSLLAKWMPSCNTSSKQTRELAQKVMKALEMSPKEYRKMLTKLRKASCLTECYLTRKRLDKIQYETVPAGAMLKYRNAFKRQDLDNFSDYLKEVADGNKKINCDTVFPYELIRPFYDDEKSNDDFKLVKGAEVLEQMWRNQDVRVGMKNALCVIDNCENTSDFEMMNALSLGIRMSEQCKGIFQNCLITWRGYPKFCEIKGDTVLDKVQSIYGGRISARLYYFDQILDFYSFNRNGIVCDPLNLNEILNMILKMVVRSEGNQVEMPSAIYVISKSIVHVSDTVKSRYASFGYELPEIVFHKTCHVQSGYWPNEKRWVHGTASVSGKNTSAFQFQYDKSVTPLSHMLRVLNSERYKEVHA